MARIKNIPVKRSVRGIGSLIVSVLFFGLVAYLAMLYLDAEERVAREKLTTDTQRAVTALFQRFMEHEQFLYSFAELVEQQSSGQGTGIDDLVQLYSRTHNDVEAVFLKNDTLAVSWKYSIRHPAVVMSMPAIAYGENFFRQMIAPQVNCSNVWKIEKNSYLTLEVPVHHANRFNGTAGIVVSCEELLRSSLQGSGTAGYETSLLTAEGERIVTSEGGAIDGPLRIDIPVAIGGKGFILQIADTKFTPWNLPVVSVFGILIGVGLLLFALLLLMLRDANRFQQSLQTIRESEEKFRIIWENSSDGMRLTDRYGRIVMVNSAYCDMVRIPPSKLLEEFNSGTIDQGRYEADSAYRQQFDAGAIKMPTSQTIKRPNGEEIPVEISNTFVRLGPDVKMMLSVYRNIAERKRMEEELQQVQKMDALGSFALEIGNTFNNIAGMILNAAEMIQKKMSVEPSSAEYIDIILSQSKRIGDLADDLLVFARSENAEVHPVHIGRCIDHVNNILLHTLPSEIAVMTDVKDDNAMVLGDVHQLHQALVNVAMAAQSRMPKGGSLQISTALVGTSKIKERFPSSYDAEDYVVVTVHDSGVPMTDTEKRRVFEPFYSTKAVTQGMGLRLAVVYGIVKRHRGIIDIISTRENGTSFILYLPVDHHEKPAEESASAAPVLDGTNLVVLVVDDEEPYRILYTRQLESMGFTVIAASDGDEAAAEFEKKKNEINLVITDLTMPKMTGDELLKKIRALNPDTKVIFATGNIDRMSRSEMLATGVSDILEKPFTFDRLMQSVQKVLVAE